MKLIRRLAFATQGALFLTLSGCGWLSGEDGLIRDSREDYRQAQVVEPMQLPAGADKQAIRELYYIPGAGQTLIFDGDKFQVPHPDMQEVTGPKELKAYKSENEHWIVIEGTPEQVWGRVRRFWDVNGIALQTENPLRGLMETVWLKRNSEGYITRDKFRVIVEYGLQKDVSEVHVMHLGYDYQKAEIPSDQLDWNRTKDGDQLALAMTQELTSFLVETESDAAPASLLAQKFVGKPKADFSVDAAGEWVIDMDLSYGRAWNAVGKAIDAVGFEIQDKNRDSGLYYLQTNSKKDAEKSGFFSFLPFVGNDKTVVHKLTISVKPADDKVQAFISQHDETLTAPLRKDIMKRIKSELI